MVTNDDLSRVRSELAQVKRALNDSHIGLFASRRLYRRLESLFRQESTLESALITQACEHHTDRVSVDDVTVVNQPPDWREGTRLAIDALDFAINETEVQSWTTGKTTAGA